MHVHVRGVPGIRAFRKVSFSATVDPEYPDLEYSASRNFDCLLFGDHGVKIVPPEQGYPVRPNDVDIDDGDDEIEDYDENVVRSLAEKMIG